MLLILQGWSADLFEQVVNRSAPVDSTTGASASLDWRRFNLRLLKPLFSVINLIPRQMNRQNTCC